MPDNTAPLWELVLKGLHLSQRHDAASGVD